MFGKLEVHVSEVMWRSKGLFPGLCYPLPWSIGFYSERGKRCSLVANVSGPWQRSAVLFFLYVVFFVFVLPNIS